MFKRQDRPQYVDLYLQEPRDAGNSTCFFDLDPVVAIRLDQQTYRCEVPDKVGAFSLRLDDSRSSIEILVLHSDLETGDAAKVRLLGDGSLELSISMQPSTTYY